MQDRTKMSRLASVFSADQRVLVCFITACGGDTTANLCGRGDKDIFTVAEVLRVEI